MSSYERILGYDKDYSKIGPFDIMLVYSLLLSHLMRKKWQIWTALQGSIFVEDGRVTAPNGLLAAIASKVGSGPMTCPVKWPVFARIVVLSLVLRS